MINNLLRKKFDMRTYNCWHFTRDAWLALTGHDLGDRMSAVALPSAMIEKIEEQVKTLTEIEQPQSPCIVVFSGPRVVPHIGVFYDGKLLQIGKEGATYAPLHVTARHFPEARYYLP